MRILHTADWHAGRTLHGRDRTDELREVLAEIGELAKSREVDLILVAGDLFDTKNPSAAAERAVFDFFLDTGRAGIPSVVIAGNHDSPARLDALGGILRLTSAHVVGSPRVAGEGGTFDLRIGEETARIAALPFVSERRIVRLRQLLEGDDGQQREHYQQSMRRLIANLSASFASDAVNLLMLHTTMEGATLANSEYVFHSTSSYTLGADLLPDSANYVALGHIHKPQPVDGYPEHAARYAGSPLQLDFGEGGDRKVVYLVDAAPSRPSEVEEFAVRAGTRLRRVRIDEDGLERRTLELADFDGYLKLVIALDAPRPGLKDRIQAAMPNVLSVELVLPEGEEAEVGGVDLEQISLVDAYRQYGAEQRGGLDDTLERAFRDLFVRVTDESDEAAAEGDPAGRPAETSVETSVERPDAMPVESIGENTGESTDETTDARVERPLGETA